MIMLFQNTHYNQYCHKSVFDCNYEFFLDSFLEGKLVSEKMSNF